MKPKRYSATNPDPIDVYVGARIRGRRTMLGMSQGDVAKRLGLTFQQVQKYERGINRIGAGRLFRLAEILDVDTAYFWDGMTPTLGTRRDAVSVAPGNTRLLAATKRLAKMTPARLDQAARVLSAL